MHSLKILFFNSCLNVIERDNASLQDIENLIFTILSERIQFIY